VEGSAPGNLGLRLAPSFPFMGRVGPPGRAKRAPEDRLRPGWGCLDHPRAIGIWRCGPTLAAPPPVPPHEGEGGTAFYGVAAPGRLANGIAARIGV